MYSLFRIFNTKSFSLSLLSPFSYVNNIHIILYFNCTFELLESKVWITLSFPSFMLTFYPPTSPF